MEKIKADICHETNAKTSSNVGLMNTPIRPYTHTYTQRERERVPEISGIRLIGMIFSYISLIFYYKQEIVD